ncbi:hypothetical protein [Methylibium rhizosphaerae]|uniref:hypothetical protein n=1 Tax=Methylibium rhizosphaerae TaxID=2570323 RepID=UPI0015E3FB58|nr:hypothetical protein [Methylibium rhizosphaerae]
MTSLKQEVEMLESRLAKAESDRDTWRVAGREEKYLEAYFLVQALELQLEQRRQLHEPH